MKYYIGIDLGTSSLKLLLVDEAGSVVNSVTKEYPVYYPKSGWSEQRSEDWYSALCEGIPELTKNIDKNQISAISAAGQMHGLVILDENDNVIRPAILWNDGRTGKETDYLNEVIGKETLSEKTANIAFAGFTLPKILWLRENEPENYKKIKKVMLPKDYINYMLTGVHSTDYSDASGMLLLDVKNKCWSPEMIKISGLDESVLPKLYESFEAIGTLKKSAAEALGLSEEVIVTAGAGDNAAAAVGTGTIGEGKCNISLGTSGTIFVSSENFGVDENNALHSFCHSDGGYHLMGCMLSAASCNKWFCDGVLETKDYIGEGARVGDELLGRNNVFFLPYLMGERSPLNDTDASALFIGLRPDTLRTDMYLAVLEGVAFAVRDNLEVIKKLGIDVKSSCLCGGGAKSVLWRKILANVLGIELTLPISEEGPGYGAAMLAMVGSGLYPSVAVCSDALIKMRDTVKPDKELVELYEERYQKFKKIYPEVKSLYKELK